MSLSGRKQLKSNILNVGGTILLSFSSHLRYVTPTEGLVVRGLSAGSDSEIFLPQQLVLTEAHTEGIREGKVAMMLLLW